MLVSRMKTRRKLRSHCPINFGLEIFGDRWSLLILRDMLILGKRSFKQFLESEEGIASNILSERLSRLEASGLIRRQNVKEDARLVYYLPTAAGQALLPALVEMSYWGAKQDPKTDAPVHFVNAYENDREALLKVIAAGFDPGKKDT